jgi:hypothetical protein
MPTASIRLAFRYFQVEGNRTRLDVLTNRIGFNSAAALLTPLMHKLKSKTPLRA